MRNRANAHQTRENTDLPRPFSDPQQGHSTSKVHHTNFGREPLYAARDEIHDSDKCQRSFPKHPSNSKVTPTDHHVHAVGSLQMDQATIWHIISLRGMAAPNPHGS